LILDNQLDRDIAARGIRVRADFVGKRNELFGGGFVYTWNENMKFDLKSEATPACWSDTHIGCDCRGAGLHVLAARYLLECRLEAGCVPGGKKLLGICALTTISLGTLKCTCRWPSEDCACPFLPP
jgi:hypothetical protein